MWTLAKALAIGTLFGLIVLVITGNQVYGRTAMIIITIVTLVFSTHQETD
jgi:hypothetical protein